MSPHHPHSTELQRRASLICGVLTAEAPVLAAVQPPRRLRPQSSVDVVQGSHRPCHLQPPPPPPPPPAFVGQAKIAKKALQDNVRRMKEVVSTFINVKDVSGAQHIQEFYSQVVATHGSAKNFPASCTSILSPGL
ncbi:hypothetical protein PIB30_096310, partial [Stylosanthes scabra]|nr:hypothetical protein [Stylosanthes scabra]